MGAQTPRRARATIQVAAASRFTRRQQPRRKKGFTPCALCLTGSSPRSPSRSPTFLVPGIQPFGFAEAWVCFAFVGLFLNIVDSFVKPFLTVISLPLTIITLGIFQLVLNSFMLELASYLSVNLLGVGISIAGFGSAFMGSILVSIMRSILDSLAEE